MNQELIQAVKAHALAHYEDGGWDIIVETWSDEEIAEQIGKATTINGALRKMRQIVSIYSEREAMFAPGGVYGPF